MAHSTTLRVTPRTLRLLILLLAYLFTAATSIPLPILSKERNGDDTDDEFDDSDDSDDDDDDDDEPSINVPAAVGVAVGGIALALMACVGLYLYRRRKADRARRAASEAVDVAAAKKEGGMKGVDGESEEARSPPESAGGSK